MNKLEEALNLRIGRSAQTIFQSTTEHLRAEICRTVVGTATSVQPSEPGRDFVHPETVNAVTFTRLLRDPLKAAQGRPATSSVQTANRIMVATTEVAVPAPGVCPFPVFKFRRSCCGSWAV